MNSDPNPSSGSGGKSMHNPPIRVTGQVMETGMPGRRDVFLKESLDLFDDAVLVEALRHL